MTCLSVLATSRALGMPDGSSLATACQHPHIPCSKHTCTSSHAPAPHASSPLRTHDEHLLNENLLAISPLAIIPRPSAGPLNAISRGSARLLGYITTIHSAKHYFATIASAFQQHSIHSGLQDRHVSAHARTPVRWRLPLPCDISAATF